MSDEATKPKPEPKQSVLVIEDDPPVQRFLRLTLSNHNYDVIEAVTAESGIRHASNDQPDLIILDLGLPDLDGVEVTRRIREWSAIPIIVVSARGKDQDKVTALDAGADDYLTKPFSVSELLARVRVAMRHSAAANKNTGDPVFRVGDLTVDLSRHQVAVAGKPIHLTRNEFRLLAALAKNAGRVMTHRQLLHDVWGPGAGEESQYLRVYMNQLRHKIEPDSGQPRYLLTEVGIGYRLASEM